jgi:hypothetical protein
MKGKTAAKLANDSGQYSEGYTIVYSTVEQSRPVYTVAAALVTFKVNPLNLSSQVRTFLVL